MNPLYLTPDIQDEGIFPPPCPPDALANARPPVSVHIRAAPTSGGKGRGLGATERDPRQESYKCEN